jgi:hypothetical protein
MSCRRLYPGPAGVATRKLIAIAIARGELVAFPEAKLKEIQEIEKAEDAGGVNAEPQRKARCYASGGRAKRGMDRAQAGMHERVCRSSACDAGLRSIHVAGPRAVLWPAPPPNLGHPRSS